MHRIDGPGATVDSLWTAGNPFGGVPATTFTPEWLNDVQESIAQAIETAGITLVKGQGDQLALAVIAITEAQVNLLTGREIIVPALVDLTAGDFFGADGLWGIAKETVLTGSNVTMIRLGTATLPKKSADTFVTGNSIYWDTVAGEATVTGTGGNKKLIGASATVRLPGTTTAPILLTGDVSPVT